MKKTEIRSRTRVQMRSGSETEPKNRSPERAPYIFGLNQIFELISYNHKEGQIETKRPIQA